LNGGVNNFKHKQKGDEDGTKPSNQLTEKLPGPNQHLSIEINKIIEKEIDRLEKDKQISNKFQKDIILLKKQWNDFCTSYRNLVGKRKNYQNTLTPDRKTKVSSSNSR
jgi:hypothetical protein